MTLLVSWNGVDTHGTASAYIAADSRVSWNGVATFDHGRKVFAFRKSPDILGYCGDVLFPTMVLSQITEMADRGLLFSPKATCKEKFEAITGKLIQQFKKYPSMAEGVMRDVLQVLHISREPNDNRKFSCWIIKWNRKDGWVGTETLFPLKSDILFSLGSGKMEFNNNIDRYRDGLNHGTSRNIFHCFCDTLFNIKDDKCGGAPQLVGVYSKPDSPAIAYGIIKDNKRYFLGTQISKSVAFDGIEWRNELFERCDGMTMKKLENAQLQPDHLRRK